MSHQDPQSPPSSLLALQIDPRFWQELERRTEEAAYRGTRRAQEEAAKEQQVRRAQIGRARKLLDLPEALFAKQAADLLDISVGALDARLAREREQPAEKRPLTACVRGKGKARRFLRDPLLQYKEQMEAET